MNKYSVTIRGHRTSYSLEKEFQSELEKIAHQQKISMAQLITSIDIKRKESNNLSSELRLFILRNLKLQIQNEFN